MKKVKVDLMVKCTPEAVIQAFISNDQLLEWWGVSKSFIEAKSFGLYILAWDIQDNRMGYVMTGIISDISAHKLIISDLTYLNPQKDFLGPMQLEISAENINKEYTRIELCQRGYQNTGDWIWYYDIVSRVWPETLKGLKTYLEK